MNVLAPSEEKRYITKGSFYKELELVFDHFPKKHMNIPLGDFNEKLGRHCIVKPTIWKEGIHQDCNDNGVRIIHFATSKNLLVKSTIFSHRNIHKYTWTSERNTRNRVDRILINKRCHSSVFDGRSYMRANCDIYLCLVVSKVRESLAVSKQAAKNFDLERFNLSKQREAKIIKEYQIEFSNRVAALENLSDSEYINRT